jgi:hypothetical protein
MGKTKYKTKRSKGSNTGTTWTDTDIEVLTTMYHAGASEWEIASILKRSTGGVRSRIYSMGLHKQPKRYETVSDTLTTEDVGDHVVSDITTSTSKPWWKRLLGIGG